MKLRAIAPAVLALAALIVLYVVVKHDSDPAASTPAQPPAPVATTPAPAVAAPPAPAPTVPATPPPVLGDDQGPPTSTPHLVSPEEFAAHEPHAKKPKMNLDEKLEATRTHIEVMDKRAKMLEDEIAQLEKNGQTDKAAEERIVLQRLKAHADKLRADVAAGREPE